MRLSDLLSKLTLLHPTFQSKLWRSIDWGLLNYGMLNFIQLESKNLTKFRSSYHNAFQFCIFEQGFQSAVVLAGNSWRRFIFPGFLISTSSHLSLICNWSERYHIENLRSLWTQYFQFKLTEVEFQSFKNFIFQGCCSGGSFIAPTEYWMLDEILDTRWWCRLIRIHLGWYSRRIVWHRIMLNLKKES